jgi:putative membrane protein
VSRAVGPVERVSSLALHWYARRAVTADVDVEVCGLEHVPTTGAVVMAARHYHHLHDATILLSVVPRPLHILVALDWVRGRCGRRIMETLCRMARWPTVLRRDSPHLSGDARASAYRPAEWHGMMRQAILDATSLMRDGRILVVFPEGYPHIDPEGAAQAGPDGFLPFRNGFARIVARAQRAIKQPIPVVPVGFSYRHDGRWKATIRFGRPRHIAANGDIAAFVRAVEHDVHALSVGESVGRIRV